MKKEHREVLALLRTRDPKDFLKVVESFECHDDFNEIVEKLREFRSKHLKVADFFISNQSSDPNQLGTSGSPLSHFLSKSLEKTEKLLIIKSKII
jgi:hypothetical protein